jgi:hypothetical protein
VPASAHQLLGGATDQAPVGPPVHVTPEMVADLHQPRLVISPEYVGRDRRDGLVRSPLLPVATRRSSHRWAQAVMVALVTTAAVVPLTLMADHAAPVQAGRGGATPTRVHAAAPVRAPRARSGSAVPSARSTAHQGRSADRAAAQSAQAAATDQRAARSARATARAQQRAAAQAARAERRSESRAARAGRQASG